MKIDFSSRRVLVTGSTSGIGLAAAKAFAQAGAHVVVNGRSTAGVEGAIHTLLEVAPTVEGFAGDLGTTDGCERLVERHPAFDVVINNIGIYKPEDFFETSDDTWEHFFQTNVMSGVRLSRAYAPGMVERGWGRVVFVSSESAINVPADMIHYGFTKTSQLAISRGLAKRLAGTGVTVNSVLPGPTLSDGVAAMLKEGGTPSSDGIDRIAADFVREHRGSSIIRRAATVEEVANMILYVSSDQASATTGAALRVDGGIVDSIV